MLNLYIILSTIVVGFTAIIWSPSSFKDILIKLFLIALTLLGILNLLIIYGYIIKH